MAEARRISVAMFAGPARALGVSGCSASGPESPFETAHSAIGAQVNEGMRREKTARRTTATEARGSAWALSSRRAHGLAAARLVLTVF